MARFRLGNDPRRMAMALWVCGVLAASGGSSAERANSGSDTAKRFVATLLKNGSARIEPDSRSCLAASLAPVTVAAELAAIFGRHIDNGWSFAVTASCEAGESAARRFCRVSFHHKDGGEEASAGFLFLGNPADGSVDTRTLECFQTP
jgi:hypothetical protein